MSPLFPDPEPSGDRGPCSWCGAPSVERVEVEPAMWSSAGGVRVLKKHAIEADVCAAHAAMVERNRSEAEFQAEKRRRKPR